jgi:formyltetrahydrofolate deformylase
LNSGILLLDCPDQRGIVAAIAVSFTPTGANILHAGQHQDSEAGMFFMRAEGSLDGFDLNEETFQEQFGAIAREFHIAGGWLVGSTATHRHLRLRYQHCLLDLLHLYEIGD